MKYTTEQKKAVVEAYSERVTWISYEDMKEEDSKLKDINEDIFLDTEFMKEFLSSGEFTGQFITYGDANIKAKKELALIALEHSSGSSEEYYQDFSFTYSIFNKLSDELKLDIDIVEAALSNSGYDGDYNTYKEDVVSILHNMDNSFKNEKTLLYFLQKGAIREEEFEKFYEENGISKELFTKITNLNDYIDDVKGKYKYYCGFSRDKIDEIIKNPERIKDIIENERIKLDSKKNKSIIANPELDNDKPLSGPSELDDEDMIVPITNDVENIQEK